MEILEAEKKLLLKGFKHWDNSDLLLIPLLLWEKIPNGTMLRSIDDKMLMKGIDNIDEDTRYGLMAVGIGFHEYTKIAKIL